MTIRRNCLLYYAKGEVYNRQTVCSILSLLNVYDKIIPETFSIVIYTDSPHAFSFLEKIVPIQTILVNDESINKWLNNSPNFLRTKICVICDCLSNNTGKMLFVDTDTIFLKKIETIFTSITPNRSFLHRKEDSLSGKNLEYIRKFYDGRQFSLKNSGKQITVFPNSRMWNSGVVGLSSENASLAYDVLDVCDQLEEISYFYLTEQFSFSLVLPRINKVRSCYKYIFHYWPFKVEMNSYLSKFLLPTESQDIDELIKRVQKNKILRTNLMEKVLFHFSPKNFGNFLKHKLPDLLGLEKK